LISLDINLIIRLVWRIINQLGEDVTEDVVEETNQEDSWTPNGQVSSSVAILQTENPSTSKLTAECSLAGSRLPVSRSHQLRVHSGPHRVMVAGLSRARAGQTVRLTCTSSRSTPASHLIWRLDQGEGSEEVEAETSVENLPDGFSLSSSTISLVMSATENLIVDCMASNPASKDFTSYQHVIQLLRPPGTPRLRHSENSHHVSCSARAGNPPASLTLYLDGEEMDAELMKEEGEDDATALAKLEPIERVQHVVCEAKNEVTSVPLRSELFVAPAATPPTSRKPSLDPTQPPRAEAQEDKRRKVRRRQKVAPVYEVPLADMPPKDDIPEDYDYSHFEYINKKFEDIYSKSASEPQHMEYFSYDYVYYSEGSVDNEEEEKVMVKVEEKVEMEMEEDRVVIVEEDGSQKVFSGSSGTIFGPDGFFSLTLVVMMRLVW